MGAGQPRALDGVTVLSVGHTLPGLYCAGMLRDLGARVIRVERPANNQNEKYQGMDEVFPIRSLTAGTDELQLDLKSSPGREAFRRMVKQTNIVIEGFRPGVMTRLGLDYPSLCKENPGIIYAAITGYGQQGPESNRAGHDINYLAETGILALSNPVGLPGVTLADGMAGVSAALNIVSAVHLHSKTGKGLMLDCAIVDGLFTLMASELEHYWSSGKARTSGSTHLTGRHPWYGVYETSDKKRVAVGAVEPEFYNNLCESFHQTELANNQFGEIADRGTAREQFDKSFGSMKQEAIMDACQNKEACISAVLNTQEVSESNLMKRALSRDEDGEPVVKTPVQLPLGNLKPGLDAAGVLASFNFSEEEIKSLTN